MKLSKAMNFIYKFGGAIASFAIMVTAFNINAACVYIAHQPKLPKDAKSLRKF